MLVCTVLFAILVIVYFPETKGLPLEEIAAKFGDEVTARLTDDNGYEDRHVVGSPDLASEVKAKDTLAEEVSTARG
jgi:hypothetical protein